MTVTDNRNLTLPTVGGNSGTWGTLLNNGVMSYLDTILGTTQSVSITASNVTLTISQWNNMAIRLTGTLTGNRNLILPLNANSATVAVGGFFIVDNQTNGAFNVTVITQASGSTGVVVPQGTRTLLFSDTTNVLYASDSTPMLQRYAGDPNGNVAGTAASVNSQPSVLWDYTNLVLWFCTATGSTSTAQWTNIVAAGASLPTPQGYLTTVSNTPVITSDSIGATNIYYTPFMGSWAVVHNGTKLIAYQFSQMQLALSTSQAANNIYDIFVAYNSGSPVIGTGPSWAAAGGSITPGSCARGTGSGSTAIQRSNGLWVNTNNISLIYNTGAGNNTIIVPAGQGVFVGSIYIDSAAGQVSCYLSVGQSRKWGVSNAYNRVPIQLICTDPNGSWGYSSSNLRPSNNDPNNVVAVFSCLAEEIASCTFGQTANPTLNTTLAQVAGNAIGLNSTSVASGKSGAFGSGAAGAAGFTRGELHAQYNMSPRLGINNIYALEYILFGSGALTTYFGTNQFMQLTVNWRG